MTLTALSAGPSETMPCNWFVEGGGATDMKIQTLSTVHCGSPGMLPHAPEIGEFQAALAATASNYSWLEAPSTLFGEIAPGIAADGPPQVFRNQQPT